MTTIGIACDHGGVELKDAIKQHFTDLSFLDLGTNGPDSVHYPEFADALCQAILNGTIDTGVLICGTGIGISMRANRHPGIRAAVVTSNFTAEMCKAHNNANVLCLGGRTTSLEDAINYMTIWQQTAFEEGRHQTRVDMLDAPLVNTPQPND
jgi:RpiB/LacA/LacB family sugar-phosphate isomerase